MALDAEEVFGILAKKAEGAAIYAEQARTYATTAAEIFEDIKDVAETIPEDYTELSNRVSDLTKIYDFTDLASLKVGTDIFPGDRVKFKYSPQNGQTIFMWSKNDGTFGMVNAKSGGSTEKDTIIFEVTDEYKAIGPKPNSFTFFEVTSTRPVDVTEIEQSLEKKMEYFKVTATGAEDNLTIQHNGVAMTYEQLRDIYLNDKYFLYAEHYDLTMIPSLPPLDYDPILEFICTWMYQGETRISRLIINGENHAKFETVVVPLKETIVELTNSIPSMFSLGEPVIVVPQTTLSFHKDGENNWYCTNENPIAGFTTSNFKPDTLYKVTWDGTEYELFYIVQQKATNVSSNVFEWGVIGNSSVLGCATTYETNAPFCIAYDYHRNSSEIQIFSYDTLENHTITIVEVPIIKKDIPEQYYKKYIGPDIRPLITRGSGRNSIVESNACDASGEYSHAEGNSTVASGAYSHAEGIGTIASGANSHAEGTLAQATGANSHAGGLSINKHTETGNRQPSVASGNGAFAHGLGVRAIGNISTAFGQCTTANGLASHAEGANTTANGTCQFVTGFWNVIDENPIDPSRPSGARKYLYIVGNGTGINARSNAYTLDWDGNACYAGNVEALGGAIKVGNTTITEEQLQKLLELLQ